MRCAAEAVHSRHRMIMVPFVVCAHLGLGSSSRDMQGHEYSCAVWLCSGVELKEKSWPTCTCMRDEMKECDGTEDIAVCSRQPVPQPVVTP